MLVIKGECHSNYDAPASYVSKLSHRLELDSEASVVESPFTRVVFMSLRPRGRFRRTKPHLCLARPGIKSKSLVGNTLLYQLKIVDYETSCLGFITGRGGRCLMSKFGFVFEAASMKQPLRSSLFEAASPKQPLRSNLCEAASSKQPLRSRLLETNSSK